MDIEQLRQYCLALPAVTEDVKWEHNLVFSIGGKMFCVGSLEGSFRFSFKVPDEEFEELSNREGFSPAPYLARAKWVLVTVPSHLKTKEWQSYIKHSYELVRNKLSKKLRADLKIN